MVNVFYFVIVKCLWLRYMYCIYLLPLLPLVFFVHKSVNFTVIIIDYNIGKMHSAFTEFLYYTLRNFWIKFPINTKMHNLLKSHLPLLPLVSRHQCTRLCPASPVVADLLRLLYDNHLHLIQDILQ